MFACRACAISFCHFKPLVLLLLLPSLSGCMGAPEFPRRVSVAEVVHNARCELYEAVSENIEAYPWLEKWAAVFDFSFKVDRDVNASADTTYLIPVQYGGFTLGITADLKQSAQGTYGLSFSILGGLGRFGAVDCTRLRAAGETPQRLLNGEIGLRRWLNEVVPQLEAAWIATGPEGAGPKGRREYAGEATKLGYTIEFGVTAEGSLLPSWSLTFPNGRQFKPALDFSASKVVTHSLIVGLTPISPPPPTDLSAIYASFEGKKVIVGRRVCVTNSDQLGQCWEGAQELKQAVDDARKNRKEAKAKVETLRSRESATRSIESPERLLKFNDTKLRDEVGTGEIFSAVQEFKAADQALRTAEKQLSDGEVVVRQTTSAAYREARIMAEADTERRLQQIVQEQILRNAFRQ